MIAMLVFPSSEARTLRLPSHGDPKSSFLSQSPGLASVSLPSRWSLAILFTNQSQLGAGTLGVLHAESRPINIAQVINQNPPQIPFSSVGGKRAGAGGWRGGPA